MGKIIDWLRGDNLRLATETVPIPVVSKPAEIRAITLPGPGYSSRNPGDPVTVQTALSLSVVYRSVSVLTTIISQLELNVLNSTGKPLNRLPDIIARPDYTMPLSKFLKKTVTSLAEYGNCYWRLWRTDSQAVPSRVEVLNPKRIRIEYDGDDNMTYVYTDRRSKSVRLQPYQVSHLTLMESFESDEDYGTGPIQRCAEEIQHALDLRDYARRVFDEYPSGIVSIKGDLDAEMRAEYKSAWYADIANGRIKFMGNEANYQSLEQDPEKTQYVSAQKLADAKIARAFGMPPNMVLVEDVSSKTYQNLQDVDKAFIRNTVEEYLTVIESALSDLLSATKTAKFNTEAWLRALTISEPAAQIEGGPVEETPVTQ